MNPIVLLLIASNVIFSYKGFNDYDFFRKNDFCVRNIRAGEQSRMFSSGFLHADWGHLFFNMFTLYMFAPVVIDELGNAFFIIIYLASLLGGSLLSLYFNMDNPMYRAVGASGAVTGILYSAILIQPNQELYFVFLPIKNFGIPAYIFGIGYLLYSIYGMKAKNDNIGHTAHFGGAIAGFALTLFREPQMLTENTQMVILLAIPIMLLFILTKTGKL
ncbi:MAG: rhomboid family intramembrane serine protease [Limnohabitans sp.]|nr:rhomboid family intramembrane serine protease [Limnohabitans sp.]